MSHMEDITPIVKSSLCDYSDAHTIVKRTITIAERGAHAVAREADERNKGVIFKYGAPFTNCISEINNTTQIDNAKDIDVVMTMYNYIEYSDTCLKTYGSFWHYYRDDPNANLEDSESFKSKIKIMQSTPDDGKKKNVEIAVPLKSLNNFRRTLEITLINHEINLIQHGHQLVSLQIQQMQEHLQ